MRVNWMLFNSSEFPQLALWTSGRGGSKEALSNSR